MFYIFRDHGYSMANGHRGFSFRCSINVNKGLFVWGVMFWNCIARERDYNGCEWHLGDSQPENLAGRWFEFWLIFFLQGCFLLIQKALFCMYFANKTARFSPIWRIDHTDDNVKRLWSKGEIKILLLTCIEGTHQGQEMKMNTKISIDQGAALQTSG